MLGCSERLLEFQENLIYALRNTFYLIPNLNINNSRTKFPCKYKTLPKIV